MMKAAPRKTTTDQLVVDDKVEKLAASLTAKQQFMGSTLNMGWRLAFTVVVPIVGGVKLDDHFHSTPSWTITGLFLATAAGCAAVWATVKEVNKEQAEDAKKHMKTKDTIK
jgi:predicted F0F1-ATPase subunit